MSTDTGKLRDETVHHYLETIYYIAHEGQVVRPGRIAEWMGVSAPSVSVTMQRLERDGWIQIAEDRSVATTPKGEDLASGIVRSHRLLERWLADVLGLDWATADEEAMRLVEGVSPEVADRLDAHLGYPSTCPHGNVIPGRAQPYGDLVSLSTLAVGTPARVRRISEVAEHDAPQLLRDLEVLGMTPDARVIAQSPAAEVGAMMVDVDGATVAIGREVAGSIWVEPEDAS